MSTSKIKQLISIILFIIFNTLIAFSITHFLGISNTVIYRSAVSMISVVTYEMVIFMLLALIESSIYEVAQIELQY